MEPFSFRIHRNLRPVFERIGVPAPRPFVADPYQNEALNALEATDVLVTAPTGAGKTYIAVKAIERISERGGKSWYASPLKALSNAKYEEFSKLFGRDNVGILTGDRKENVQAPIIVGTTEILRNQLYDTMHRGEDLEVDLVVLDEAHYLGDEDRGVVWEEVLIYLPSRVRLLLLSATIQNAGELCAWLEWLRRAPCRWVAAFERPVPLYPLFMFPSGEMSPLSTRRGLFPKIRTVDRRSFPKRDLPEIPKLLEALRRANLLPAIFFLKSRSDCDKAVALFNGSAGFGNRDKNDAFRERVRRLLDIYPFLRRHRQLSALKRSRVGAHHGGQLPHWKLFLEKLMQEGHLDAIFSTSTVAAGVNFPARTVVVLQSDRFNGKEFVELSATDLLQMTGRAGRRGMDEIGFVFVVPGPFQDPQLIHDLLKSPPDPILSQIRVNFSMALNLLLSHTPDEIRGLFASSLATFQSLSREVEVTRKAEAARKELEEWLPETACGSIETLADVRPRYAAIREQLRKSRRLMSRRFSRNAFHDLLVPGRVFLSRRGTPYVVVAHPEFHYGNVEAVRLAAPLRMKRGRIRTRRVAFNRIAELSEKLGVLPSPADRGGWERLLDDAAAKPFRPMEQRRPPAIEAAAGEVADAIVRKSAMPCDACALHGPCHKGASHPFADALQNYFEHHARMSSIQEELWRSFQRHYRLLGEEGYVDADGRLTEDGQWASKLRLDQPLLISDGIRKGVFSADKPEMLAALIAPFVMDRDKPGDIQLSAHVWKYPDIAKPFFRMLQTLQPLRERLQAEGFATPPLPFWAVVTVYHWALGCKWEEAGEISGMDEGDLAMVILRTADHLRQIESLSDTHPELAASARKAGELILREPVLVE